MGTRETCGSIKTHPSIHPPTTGSDIHAEWIECNVLHLADQDQEEVLKEEIATNIFPLSSYSSSSSDADAAAGDRQAIHIHTECVFYVQHFN